MENIQILNMPPTRQRASARRSRTGCRTCRLRHVKCDETPVSCINCTSAGWKCDGYESRLLPPRKTKQAKFSLNTSTPLPRSQALSTHLPGGSSDERRGFAYFQTCTVPEMSSLFDTDLWLHFILPISHAERAVAHSVVALSTLHEDMKTRGAPIIREDLTHNSSHLFALQQYTRALSCLNTRRHSNDPKLRGVVLTCCFLFALFEILRAQYESAFDHLKWGITIINGSHSQEKLPCRKQTCCPSSLISLPSNALMGDNEAVLEVAMSRLHYQSTFFGIDVSLVPEFGRGIEMDSPDEFESISQARKILDVLFDKACRLVSTYARLSPEEQLLDHHRLKFESAQQEMRTKFTNYSKRLTRSEGRLSHLAGKGGSRSIDVMRLYYKTCTLMLETFIEKDDVSYDPYIHDFRDLVTTSERVANSFIERGGPMGRHTRPTLLMDTGVIPALTYVCMKCPDASLRRRALKNLEAWPHREGPWDSTMLAIMASEIIQAETAAEMQRLSPTAGILSASHVTYIPAASRLTDSSLIVDDDQRTAVFRYTNRANGFERSEKQKLIKIS